MANQPSSSAEKLVLVVDDDRGVRELLLDLMLPKANGLEIVRELQADDTGGIPIIIMTGRAMDRSTSELIKHERNVKEYLEKPVKTALLGALLHKLLNTRPPVKRPA